MIENPQIFEIHSLLVTAQVSGHRSLADNGRARPGHVGFVFGGGRGSKISARGRVTRKRASTRCFSVSPVFNPTREGGDLCRAPQGPPCPCRVPVAMNDFMTHFDGVEGLV